MIKAYCISDNNTDAYTQDNLVYPGGSGLNAAVNFVRTGNQAAYCGFIGNDYMGNCQRDGLIAEGVDVSNLLYVNCETDWALTKLVDGNRTWFGGGGNCRKNFHFKAEDVKKGQTGEYDLIYTCAEATFDPDGWAQLGESDVPVCCDYSNNWEKRKGCDYLKASEGIVDYFYMSMEGRSETAEELCRRCVDELGGKFAIATNGSKGSTAYNGRKFYHQDAYLVKAKDTMAAGDTYLASFTSSYFDGLKLLKACAAQIGWDENNEHYQACEDKLIEKSLAFAAMCSAKNCMMDGGFGHAKPFDIKMFEGHYTVRE